MKAVSLRDLLKNPVHFLAFGLGSGAAPKAPGTFGTLAAVILYLGLQYLPFWNYVLVLAVATVLGIWLCDKTSRDLGVHDHPGIVWDEFVGYWITMLAAPKGWVWIITGFVLFRFFDILKPWPIKVIDQKVHGGFGIMLDDILAGVFSFIALQLLAQAFI
ncbi:phosphatidylglycerophosphatase A family protein [Endozoicomonadaceae bacterium StTr2]